MLADSRDVTKYARVLVHDQAHEVLRRHNDLRLAEQVIDRAELSLRVRRVGDSIELLIDELQREEPVEDDVVKESQRVSRLARTLREIAAAAAHEDDVT